jgi:hypothetical protein
MSQQFKAYIEDRVNNKPFDYHRNDTRIGGFLRNRSGDEYFFNGNTGTAEITLESDSVAMIVIPYSGHYRRKHFIGVQNEYRTEARDIRGKYKVKLTLSLFSSNLEDLGFVETGGDVQDAGHDSHQCAKNGLFEDIVAALTRR